MWSLLNAFAAGITFSLGVCVGAYLARLATKIGQAELQKDLREHAARVEDRLAKYVEHTAVIAAAAQTYMDHVKRLPYSANNKPHRCDDQREEHTSGGIGSP